MRPGCTFVSLLRESRVDQVTQRWRQPVGFVLEEDGFSFLQIRLLLLQPCNLHLDQPDYHIHGFDLLLFHFLLIVAFGDIENFADNLLLLSHQGLFIATFLPRKTFCKCGNGIYSIRRKFFVRFVHLNITKGCPSRTISLRTRHFDFARHYLARYAGRTKKSLFLNERNRLFQSAFNVKTKYPASVRSTSYQISSSPSSIRI